MSRLAELIIGNPSRLPLQHLILNLLVFVGLLTGLFFGVSDIIVGLDPSHKLFDLLLIAAFSTLYWITRVLGRFVVVSHLMSVLSLTLASFNFLINSGIHGPSLLVVCIVSTCTTMLHSWRFGLLYLLYGVALAAGCLLIQYFHPEWIVGYTSPQTEFWDITMTFLFCLFATYAVMRLVLTFFQKILDQTKEARSAVLQSEKMASLGALLAAMNHEINTPVGVIGSSLSAALGWWERDFPQFARVLAPLMPVQNAAFWTFLADTRSAAPIPDSRGRRTRRAHLAEALDFLPAEEALVWAEEWEAMGILEWNPAWRPLFETEDGMAALRFALSVLASQRSQRHALLAYEKLHGLVRALGSYSRTEGPEQNPVPTRVEEGLETVLLLYGVGVKNEVEIVRDFEEVPPVLARPDELMQVWTNLIQNALQAMEYRGVLTVSLRREGRWAVVSVSDTGPGVPDTLRERIFEPFFTTKQRGQGTGLGLGIVGGIVAAQGGTISVENVPSGGARFVVSLPLASQTLPSA